jgi:hypothetical protein
MQVDEEHAAGETSDRLGDLLLAAGIGGLRTAALLQGEDVAFQGAVEAPRIRRRDRGPEGAASWIRLVF